MFSYIFHYFRSAKISSGKYKVLCETSKYATPVKSIYKFQAIRKRCFQFNYTFMSAFKRSTEIVKGFRYTMHTLKNICIRAECELLFVEMWLFLYSSFSFFEHFSTLPSLPRVLSSTSFYTTGVLFFANLTHLFVEIPDVTDFLHLIKCLRFK